MAKENSKNKKVLQEKLKKLVIARIEVMPSDKKLSIGSEKELTKEELIEHVEKGDEIGKKITEVQWGFLKSLKEGIFYGQDISNNKT